MTTHRHRLRRPWWLAIALVSVPVFAASGSSAATATTGSTGSAEYRRSLAHYAVPDVTLLDQDGASVRLQDVLSADRPTFVQFVFTSCPTICPILGAIFSNFQSKLGEAADGIRFVSVSIDPQHDNPEKMKAFLKRHHAKDNWTFLTGKPEDIQAVQRAFDAYTENKMSHSPLTFFSSPSDRAWVRIGGFIGAAELVAEYQGARHQ